MPPPRKEPAAGSPPIRTLGPTTLLVTFTVPWFTLEIPPPLALLRRFEVR